MRICSEGPIDIFAKGRHPIIKDSVPSPGRPPPVLVQSKINDSPRTNGVMVDGWICWRGEQVEEKEEESSQTKGRMEALSFQNSCACAGW